MNKPLKKKNQSVQLLSVSPVWEPRSTWSTPADAEKRWGGRRVTTSCLGNYHHFWRELRGLLTAPLSLLNSLCCWLMMKREHAPTPLMGLWHNVPSVPCAPASWAGYTQHTQPRLYGQPRGGPAMNTLFICIWRNTLPGTHGPARTRPFKFSHFIISVTGLRSHTSL